MSAARARPRSSQRRRITAVCSAAGRRVRWRSTVTATTTATRDTRRQRRRTPRADARRFHGARDIGRPRHRARRRAPGVFRGVAPDGLFRRRDGACRDPRGGAVAGVLDVGIRRRTGGGAGDGGGGLGAVRARLCDGHAAGRDGAFGAGLRPRRGVVSDQCAGRSDGLSVRRHPVGVAGRSGGDLGRRRAGRRADAVALVGAVAIKVVGVLLITALLIIPAAAARPFVRTPEGMAVLAAGLGGVSAVAGLQASYRLDTPAGPTIVCVVALLFMASAVTGALRR